MQFSITSVSRVAFVFMIVVAIATAQIAIRRNGNCFDKDRRCASWAHSGHCYKNRGFMEPNCPSSCHKCNVIDSRCQDERTLCPAWAQDGECLRNSKFMSRFCRRSCSICLPSNDRSVPQIDSHLRQQKWTGNEINVDIL